MSVEVFTALAIIAAWCLVAYRVEKMKLQNASKLAIVRHLAIGTALAVALFAPGAWGKFALAVGVLVLYLLSVQTKPVNPSQTGRQMAVVMTASSPVARALERRQTEGLASARQRQG